MPSLRTQIAGFSFDNCLMNAAGVACMTVEELEEVRQSTACNVFRLPIHKVVCRRRQRQLPYFQKPINLK